MTIKTTWDRFWDALSPEERKCFDKNTHEYLGPFYMVQGTELNQEFINELTNEQREELFDNGLINAEQYNIAVRLFKEQVAPFVEHLQKVGTTLQRIPFSDTETWFFNKNELDVYVGDKLITSTQYSWAIRRHGQINAIYENLLRSKRIKVANIEYSKLPKRNYSEIDFRSFLVLSNCFNCNKNHHIEQIKATVNVLTNDAAIIKVSVPAGYCAECGVYFVLEKDYQDLLLSGVPLCQKITYEQYCAGAINGFNGASLSAESLLHQIGYSVSAQDNLSSLQRKTLLSLAIQLELYSVSGLLSFLDWLIDKNSKVKSRDMSAAIEKWKDDRDFVAKYAVANATREVNIGTIKSKKKTFK